MKYLPWCGTVARAVRVYPKWLVQVCEGVGFLVQCDFPFRHLRSDLCVTILGPPFIGLTQTEHGLDTALEDWLVSRLTQPTTPSISFVYSAHSTCVIMVETIRISGKMRHRTPIANHIDLTVVIAVEYGKHEMLGKSYHPNLASCWQILVVGGLNTS